MQDPCEGAGRGEPDGGRMLFSYSFSLPDISSRVHTDVVWLLPKLPLKSCRVVVGSSLDQQ